MDEKKLLMAGITLCGTVITFLLAINGFFLVKLYDRLEVNTDKVAETGQRVAVLTARFDTYVTYKKNREEDVSYGQSVRKRVRYRLIEGI